MGWERKRGKLIEFNRYLLNDGETSYFIKAGPLEALENIRYVITLDADTILPRGSARKLIGTIAHPCSKRKSREGQTMVASGYGVIQPRIGLTAASAFASPFSKMYTGTAGLGSLYLRNFRYLSGFIRRGHFYGKRYLRSESIPLRDQRCFSREYHFES